MHKKMNISNFLELIENSDVVDKEENIFKTKLEYKNFIEIELKTAEREAEETIFDDVFGVKEENNNIKFKLTPSKLKEKLNILFFSTEKDFLQKIGIKKLEKEVFIFDKKANLKNYLKCYDFFVTLKEFLSEISITNNSLKKEIILYYKEPIIIKEDIQYLKCDDFYKKFKLLEKLKKDIQLEPQTRNEFIKKAIYDIFKEKIKNNNLTINEIAEKFDEIDSEYFLIKRAYIDSLDTDKIKDDFKNKYHETLNFINNIISNLYTKTLFVPLTLIFGISQKLTTSKNYINQLYIFFSLIVFLLILAYLIWGNLYILKNIKVQIDELEQETKYFNNFKNKVNSLLDSYKGVRNRIYFILIFIIISIIILTYIYLPFIKKLFVIN